MAIARSYRISGSLGSPQAALVRGSEPLLPAREVKGPLLPALALAMLLCPLGLMVSMSGLPRLYWPLLAGAPLLLGVVLTARMLRLDPQTLGLLHISWRTPLIALSGAPLALLAYSLLRPRITELAGSALDLVAAPIVLFFCVALLGELLFRGLLRRVAPALGRGGRLLSATLFAATYLWLGSPPFLLFVALLGLFYDWAAARDGSLWGVIVSHALMILGALVVLPLRIGARPLALATLAPWLLGAVVLLALVALALVFLPQGAPAAAAAPAASALATAPVPASAPVRRPPGQRRVGRISLVLANGLGQRRRGAASPARSRALPTAQTRQRQCCAQGRSNAARCP
jgi:membrane protease YdiL (CAAX protease family)